MRENQVKEKKNIFHRHAYMNKKGVNKKIQMSE